MSAFKGEDFYTAHKDDVFLADVQIIENILCQGKKIREKLKSIQAGSTLRIGTAMISADNPLIIKKGGPGVVIGDNDYTLNRLTGMCAAYCVTKNIKPKCTMAILLGLDINTDIKMYYAAAPGAEHFTTIFGYFPLLCAMQQYKSGKVTKESIAWITRIASVKTSTDKTLGTLLSEDKAQLSKHLTKFGKCGTLRIVELEKALATIRSLGVKPEFKELQSKLRFPIRPDNSSDKYEDSISELVVLDEAGPSRIPIKIGSTMSAFKGEDFYTAHKDDVFLADVQIIENILCQGKKIRGKLKSIQAGSTLQIGTAMISADNPLIIKKGGPGVVIGDNDYTLNRLTGMCAAYCVTKNIKPKCAMAISLGLDINTDKKMYYAAAPGAEHFTTIFGYFPLLCAMQQFKSGKVTKENIARIESVKTSTDKTLGTLLSEDKAQLNKHLTKFGKCGTLRIVELEKALATIRTLGVCI